jgi:hypothetical protein
MAVSLKLSTTKGNRRMRSTKRNGRGAAPNISSEEALQLLQSAIGYLQLTGITVQAQNSANGLVLTVPGAHYVASSDGLTAVFCIGSPDATNNGTSANESVGISGTVVKS